MMLTTKNLVSLMSVNEHETCLSLQVFDFDYLGFVTHYLSDTVSNQLQIQFRFWAYDIMFRYAVIQFLSFIDIFDESSIESIVMSLSQISKLTITSNW